MIRSMTGFGKATLSKDGKTVTAEIRSLNSKGADISMRLSSSLRNYELDVRNLLSQRLERGKIDLSISLESGQAELPVEINVPLAKAYFEQLRNLSIELGVPLETPIYHILKFPDVLSGVKQEVDENDWQLINACISQAIDAVNKFRAAEGEALYRDFEQRISKIETALDEVVQIDVNRLKSIKERIRTSIVELLGKEKLDENRFEQELIYYVEKLDINEEKVRLRQHLDYFLKTCREDSPGRKLNFISQEIGREINTMGAKANDVQIQRLVVLMKDELEKIKEQANNVL